MDRQLIRAACWWQIQQALNCDKVSSLFKLRWLRQVLNLLSQARSSQVTLLESKGLEHFLLIWYFCSFRNLKTKVCWEAWLWLWVRRPPGWWNVGCNCSTRRSHLVQGEQMSRMGVWGSFGLLDLPRCLQCKGFAGSITPMPICIIYVNIVTVTLIPECSDSSCRSLQITIQTVAHPWLHNMARVIPANCQTKHAWTSWL